MQMWHNSLGTGSVGQELSALGFKNITALDFCQEMLDVAEGRGIVLINQMYIM